MAETLGMLCDKLTIVKLKQYHTEDAEKLKSLAVQAGQLQLEIDEYVNDALQGRIPQERLTFDANKVYKQEGNRVAEVTGFFGELVAQLADTNCLLWHEQEKVYEFEKVTPDQKDHVVKQLAILNLQRNKCIDGINLLFKNLINKNS